MQTNTVQNNSNNVSDNISNDISDNISDDNLEQEISQSVISLLEDKGYTGNDLLLKLSSIYEIYESQHIKKWTVDNIYMFTLLKDTIWYNFEHKPNSTELGISSLKYLGTRFPAITYLFDQDDTIAYLYLPRLLEELNTIIKLWPEDKELYIAELYSDNGISLHGGDTPTDIIIHMQGQHPSKYAKDCLETVSSILDEKGNNIKTKKRLYGYCSLQGPINNFEQSSVYFNILLSLKENVVSAINNHKDLKLVTNDYMRGDIYGSTI